jgi:hypothetical protein
MGGTAMNARGEPRSLPEDRERARDRFWAEVSRGGDSHPGGLTRCAEPFLKSARAATEIDLVGGPGRDMAFLLERGYTVLGVDWSGTAIELARKSVSCLPADAQARARLVRSEATDFLAALASESVDAIHAASTYQAFTDAELSALFREVHRTLISGGLHVWSVRSDQHRGATEPGTATLSFPNLGFTVQVRFFTKQDYERLPQGGFHCLERREAETVPGRSSLWMIDRKGPE